MGNRISKVYTKNGDQGTTMLADGEQVPKTHHRIKAFSEVDHLNSVLGTAIAVIEQDKSLMPSHIDFLTDIQHRLFDIGGEFSIPGSVVIEPEDIELLEHNIEHYNDSLKPLKNFVLPGGSVSSTHLHMARTAARKAEISAWECFEKEKELGELEKTLNPESLRFLNRLSDLLFVIARFTLIHDDRHEVMWRPKKRD